jgi:integrase
MPRRLPPGCVEDADRHGTVRIYYRVKGKPKIRLRGMPWTAEFMTAYEEAKGEIEAKKKSGIGNGTWRWLCVKYFAECADFRCLDDRTQYVRRRIIESTFDEQIAPGSHKFYRDFPLGKMTVEAIEVLRDRKITTPAAANGRLKAIRQVFKWGVSKKSADGRPFAPSNPTRDVPYLKSGSTGFHSWTPDEVRQFEERHHIGTKARLALALLLFTGQRRSDITRLGRQHVRNGRLTFTQYKGRKRNPKQLTLPIIPALQRIIELSPCGELTFLVNDLGRPYTDAGFGNKFRQWCSDAGLRNCSAHGLRKAGATIAADNGATTKQLMAIFGWSSSKMAEHYTRATDQKRLAESAMHMLETREQKGPELGPTGRPSGTFSEKS